MSHLTKAHFAFIAVGVALGAAMIPAPVEAARLSNADKVALKQAIVACKAQAKGRKVKLARAPEVREQLRLRGPEGTSKRRHCSLDQGASKPNEPPDREMARLLAA
ncbi:hypothetical protein [Bradyrhizobium sp. JR3.5]